jgi:chemotaxis protein MotB
MKATMIFIACLLLTQGCVRSSTYEALQKQYQDQLKWGDSLTLALHESQQEAQDLRNKKSALETQISNLNKEKTLLLQDRSQLQGSIENMQKALDEQAKRQAEVEGQMAQFRHMLERLKPLIDTGKLKVKIAEGRMVVVLATDILFGKGSAELSDQGRLAIEEVSQILATFNNRSFQVEGHTDNDPISNQRYPSNWELAAGRAINVVKTMINAGMPPSQVSAASYGEFRPVAINESKENMALNRRIEIVILPDLSLLPGFDELNRMNVSIPGQLIYQLMAKQ